jgi:hypothetical protein
MRSVSDEELQQLISTPAVDLRAIENQYGIPSGILDQVLKGENSRADQVSNKGASGRFQIMPANARAYGANTKDYESSAIAAAKLIADAKRVYLQKHPNISNEQLTPVLLAHYNGGWREGNSVATTGKAVSAETKKYLVNTGANQTQSVAPTGQPRTVSDAELAQIVSKPATLVNPNTINDGSIDAVKVAGDSAINTLSAGTYRRFAPEKYRLATPEQIAEHPVAETVGAVAGTVPYMYIPGGVPTQMAIMGTRGATQAAMEGKSGTDIATAGAIEGAMPVVGAVAGKVVSKGLALGGKTVRAAGNRMFSNPPPHSAEIAIQGETGAYLRAYITGEKAAAISKPVSVNELTNQFKINFKNAGGGDITSGVVGAYAGAQNEEHPVKGAIIGGAVGAYGPAVVKAAMAKTLLDNIPRLTPELATKALKYLPTGETAGDALKFKDFWIEARIGKMERSRDALLKEKHQILSNLPANATDFEKMQATKDISNRLAKNEVYAEADIKQINAEADAIFTAAQQATSNFIKKSGNITRATTNSAYLTGAKTGQTVEDNRRVSGRQVSDEYFQNILKGK